MNLKQIALERKKREIHKNLKDKGHDNDSIKNIEEIIEKYKLNGTDSFDISNKGVEVKIYLDHQQNKGYEEIIIDLLFKLIEKFINTFNNIKISINLIDIYFNSIIYKNIFLTENEIQSIVYVLNGLEKKNIIDSQEINNKLNQEINNILEERHKVRCKHKIIRAVKKNLIGLQNHVNDFDSSVIPPQFVFKYKIWNQIYAADIRYLKKIVDNNYFLREYYIDHLGNILNLNTIERMNNRWKYVNPYPNIKTYSMLSRLYKLRTNLTLMQNLIYNYGTCSWLNYHGLDDNANIESLGVNFAYLTQQFYLETVQLLGRNDNQVVIEISNLDMSKTVYCVPHYSNNSGLNDGEISFSPQVYSMLNIEPNENVEVYVKLAEVENGNRIKIQPLSSNSNLIGIDYDSIREIMKGSLNNHRILSTDQIIKIDMLNEFIHISVEPQSCIGVRNVELNSIIDLKPVLDTDLSSEETMLMYINNLLNFESRYKNPDHPYCLH